MFCSYCKKVPPLEGKKKCADCTVKQSFSNKKSLDKKRQAGICTRCNLALKPGQRDRCPSCKKIHNQESKIRKDLRVQQGLCAECGKRPLSGRSRSCGDCVLKAMAKIHFKKAEKVKLLREIFDHQNICPYSGIQLVLGLNASLDHRIAKSKGGNDEPENLQFVHSWINTMKSNSSEEEFLKELDSFLAQTVRFRMEEKRDGKDHSVQLETALVEEGISAS